MIYRNLKRIVKNVVKKEDVTNIFLMAYNTLECKEDRSLLRYSVKDNVVVLNSPFHIARKLGDFSYMVLDEAHCIKNATSLRRRNLEAISAHVRNLILIE